MMQMPDHEQKMRYSRWGIQAMVLLVVIVFLIAAMIGGELSQFYRPVKTLSEASFKYASKEEFQRLIKGQMAFTAVNYDAVLKNDNGFVVDGPIYGGRSNFIVLHFPYQDMAVVNPIMHLNSIYGSKMWIFNDDNHLIYSDDKIIQDSHAVYELSEVYLPFDVTGINVLIEGGDADHYIGIDGNVSIMPYQESLNRMFVDGYPRRVVGFFLMIAALSLFMIQRLFSMHQSKSLFEALGFFFGVFGIWIMLDFGRYNLWILNVFHGVPSVGLKILYFFAMAFLNYGFTNLCYCMFLNTRFKKWLYWLNKYALVLGWTYFITTTVLLFYWTPALYQIHQVVQSMALNSVTVGSLLLLVISLVEAFTGNRTAVIFATGFGLCEITFIISQTTPILISHWGVMIMAMTFAVIISGEFDKAKKDNLVYTKELELKNKELFRLYSDLEGAQHEILYLLGSAVDLRSKETSNHVKRVAEYSHLFATQMGYGKSESDLLALASTLHDIGKVGISDTILNKPGILTPEEYESMKEHALMGYDMLKESELELIRTAAIVAISHHERYDGAGYPNGLKADEIHPYGRIVAASDVLDALLSSRVYKEAWPFEQVLAYFKEQRGKQFDPVIVDIFVNQAPLFKTISETYL